MGKGSSRRPNGEKNYEDNYDRIFRKKQDTPPPPPPKEDK